MLLLLALYSASVGYGPGVMTYVAACLFMLGVHEAARQ